MRRSAPARDRRAARLPRAATRRQRTPDQPQCHGAGQPHDREAAIGEREPGDLSRRRHRRPRRSDALSRAARTAGRRRRRRRSPRLPSASSVRHLELRAERQQRGERDQEFHRRRQPQPVADLGAVAPQRQRQQRRRPPRTASIARDDSPYQLPIIGLTFPLFSSQPAQRLLGLLARRRASGCRTRSGAPRPAGCGRRRSSSSSSIRRRWAAGARSPLRRCGRCRSS